MWRALGDVGAGGSSLEYRQATQSSYLLPWHGVRRGLGSRWRSGIVLLTSPVDVLEQGHGEGHAQNLKDMGNGLRQKPCGWGH